MEQVPFSFASGTLPSSSPFSFSPGYTSSSTFKSSKSKPINITDVVNTNKTSQHETLKETISLKVAVEKQKKRVVFAESNNDFIDVIFSFFTLPIGSILSILEGNSQAVAIGCMNNLYGSVRELDARLFSTEACKEMLLHTRRLPVAQCRKLKLKYDDNLKTPKCFYFCKNLDCRRQCKGRLSEIPNARCHCGQLMDQMATLSEKSGSVTSDEDGGVFVKGGSELFLITDNMQVMPGLTSLLSIQLLKKLGITDANELEIQSVDVGPKKVMELLGQACISKTPLTHWILSEQHSPLLTKDEQESSAESKPFQVSSTRSFEEHFETNESKKMRVVLFISKSQNTVLYAECEEDFVDFLFSFLTFPLGSILKILDMNSQLGSFDNLYTSISDLGINGHLKSEELRDMLLCPKLASYFACDNQLLQIEESCHPKYKLEALRDILRNETEWFVQPASSHEYRDFTSSRKKIDLSRVINPKFPTGESKPGGGFTRGPAKFMVTDVLTVKPLSPIESISFIGKSNVPITDVHEMAVEIGVEEAKSLLRAALTSKTAWTDVFRERLK